MNKLLERNRLIYLDVLRIIASFCVVVIHVSSQGLGDFEVTGFSWNICNIADSISRFAVPVFLMISGCFFLNPDKVYSVRSILNKIFRLIVAFFFWSLIYAVRIAVYEQGESVVSVLYAFVLNTITGNYHMWFVFLIIGLYVISPILRKITAEKRITEFFFIITFVFTFGIVFLEKVFQSLLGTNIFLNLISEILTSVLSDLNLTFLSGNVFYFIIGYYLNRYDFTKKKRFSIYIAGIISALIIMCGTYFLSSVNEKTTEVFYDYLSFPCCIVSVAVFIAVKNLFANINIKENLIRKIFAVSKLTFGIYLIHVLIIGLFLKLLNLNVGSFNAALSVPLLSVAVFGVSLLFSFVLSKIPLLNKYVI